MTQDRVDWHLWNWSQWMQTGQYATLTVKLASLESGHTRSRSFDDMLEDGDRAAAKATNAVVGDLSKGPVPLRQAIESYYLGHAWRSSLILTPIVDLAREKIGLGLDRKGFV